MQEEEKSIKTDLTWLKLFQKVLPVCTAMMSVTQALGKTPHQAFALKISL